MHNYNAKNFRLNIHINSDILTATMQGSGTSRELEDGRYFILNNVQENSLKGVVLDLSGMNLIDSTEFREIRDTIKMIEILGVKVVLIGLNQGVISHLVNMNIELDGMRTTCSMSSAIEILNRI